MKTKEEIDELYHKLYTISIDGEDNLHYYSFVEGYNQCQEDMAKEIAELKMLCRDMSRIYSKDVKALNNMLNSLNKQD